MVVCPFTTSWVAPGRSEYVVPEMVRGGPPGRRVCEEKIRPEGVGSLGSYVGCGMGVSVMPFSRVMGRGTGASVIWAEGGVRGMVWVPPITTWMCEASVCTAMGVLEMVIV